MSVVESYANVLVTMSVVESFADVLVTFDWVTFEPLDRELSRVNYTSMHSSFKKQLATKYFNVFSILPSLY